MEYAGFKIVVVADFPDSDAVVASPEQIERFRRAAAERMDLMVRAAMGAPMSPPEPTVLVWPQKPARPDPYGIMAIRNIA